MDAGVSPDRPRRRRHPSRGARSVALAASVASTAGLATWIAYGEGAFETASSAEAEQDSGTGANVPALPPDLVPPASSTTVAPTTTTENLAASPADNDGVDDDLVADVDGVGDDLDVDETLPDDLFTTAPEPGVADGVFAGTAEYTEWGDVQVQITIVGGLTVDVEAIEIPAGRRSTRINDRAAPILEADAIALQTADLDIVSGATYTSLTYADSLQAALDAAALAAEVAGAVGVSA